VLGSYFDVLWLGDRDPLGMVVCSNSPGLHFTWDLGFQNYLYDCCSATINSFSRLSSFPIAYPYLLVESRGFVDVLFCLGCVIGCFHVVSKNA